MLDRYNPPTLGRYTMKCLKYMLDVVILLSHMGVVPDHIPLAWHSRDEVPLRL